MTQVSTELTPAEIWLLNTLYELGEADIYGVLDHIKDEKDWKYTTVQTMIHHMCDKGFIVRKKDGRRFVYKPTRSRSSMFQTIIDRLFGNSLKEDPIPLVDYLAAVKKLSKKNKKILIDILADNN